VQGIGLQGLGCCRGPCRLAARHAARRWRRLHTPEGADRKAYTARTFGTSSADFVKRMLNDPASVGSKEYSRVLAISGGLPIRAGDEIVGAVGVSGSPGRDDECSQAGIDKVAAL
jgi:uncharacterized protein GlcG (DUF336 family)